MLGAREVQIPRLARSLGMTGSLGMTVGSAAKPLADNFGCLQVVAQAQFLASAVTTPPRDS
jgi:hypothetical protein